MGNAHPRKTRGEQCCGTFRPGDLAPGDCRQIGRHALDRDRLMLAVAPHHLRRPAVARVLLWRPRLFALFPTQWCSAKYRQRMSSRAPRCSSATPCICRNWRPSTPSRAAGRAHEPSGFIRERFPAPIVRDSLRWTSNYSHSIVPGGLLVTSYTTRFMPFTSLMIRVATRPSTSCGNGKKSAVMPSVDVTARKAHTWS